jgi:dihydrofolate synthase/folylpolyglutamate synthase
MGDFARSADPAVQAELDLLSKQSPAGDQLGLDRITRLLDRLGRPQDRLPPVLHVAGTNGKGSTCAFLRAALEAAGRKVHAFTSPHLVRFNERIRIAGSLIGDEMLAGLLAEALDAADGIDPSFFEATTAAAFLAFSRIGADACIVEVGLGGRLDATNVLPAPAVCGIAQLGIDHQAFLGERIEQIAAEKAGIAKKGVPLVTQLYPEPLAEQIREAAEAVGAEWLPREGLWNAEAAKDSIRYRDVHGALDLPKPRLAGSHQAMNAALAVAMIRHQDAVRVDDSALAAAMEQADWPARLQLLGPGPLRALLPDGSNLWVDGGHNSAAAAALAEHFRAEGGRLYVVLGLLANREPEGVLAPFKDIATRFYGVPVPGHAHHSPEELSMAARSFGIDGKRAADPAEALRTIREPGDVLIFGSLYLAGEVLKLNGQPPD